MNRPNDPFFVKRKLNIEVIKPIAYKFKSTNSLIKVKAYIDKCIQDGVSFDTDGIYLSLVDKALSELIKGRRVAVIVRTEKEKRLLSLVFNIKRVYTVDNIPDNVENAVCYCGVIRKEISPHINVLTTLLRKQQ